MNKFVKLPLFLGLTCLVFGGMLAGVVALTEPVIQKAKEEKLNAVYKNLYNDESATKVKEIKLADGHSEKILELVTVNHSDEISAVYKLKSKSTYEQMIFYVGISTSSKVVDGYYSLETNTTSLGYNQFKNNESVSELMSGYDGSGDLVIAGVTYTSKGVTEAIKEAFNDFNKRPSTDWGE